MPGSGLDDLLGDIGDKRHEGESMTEWKLEVDYIPPEMDGLPWKGTIKGPAYQITMIMEAVAGGKIK